MRYIFETPRDMPGVVGQTFGPTDWLLVDQARIDLFAEATGDHQWIHVDPERAKTGPFGGTIAHGYLTLSLTNLFLPQLIEVRGISMGINYGLDKVRFPSVVLAGTRIRGRGELISATEIAGGIQSIIRLSVDVEGGEKPACVAEAISRWYPL
jgi:acyl dehydratase